jgi:hypothetical protein
MELAYAILNYVIIGLNCLLCLAGAVAGILALVRKQTLPGILALAAFVFLGLNVLANILMPFIVTPLTDQFGINIYLYANLCTTAPLHFLGILGLVILAFLNVRKKQEKAGPEIQAPPLNPRQDNP